MAEIFDEIGLLFFKHIKEFGLSREQLCGEGRGLRDCLESNRLTDGVDGGCVFGEG